MGGLLPALCALAVLALASLLVGSVPIPVADAVASIVAFDPADAEHIIVRDMRVPRTLLAVLVGGALGLAGALIQALTRNPLAGPGILGVNAGAAFAVVLVISIFGVTSLSAYVWAAFAGALVAAAAVYGLSTIGRGGADPVRMVLSGVAVGAVLTGLTSTITLVDETVFDHFRYWAVGSLAGRDIDVVRHVIVFVVCGIVLALALAGNLNALALGEELATAQGARVGRTRALGVLAVTALCGSATAAVGPIGFVGLVVPHIARWICGPDQRWILTYSLLLGPTLTLAADIVARTIVVPAELPAGVVTAFFGAPVLIALVRRTKLSQL
ncbi:FecCD family ABC transporter permease [Phytohabitans kaempferiae]|uniref:FecCD family ABC transporter permease n=1 Tax=Phytohabitans kaempferiae TaxID=1620943 RepID=A0ABV6M6Z9_9ACTN